MPVRAQRAVVRPRVISQHAQSEAAVLLEDLVAQWLDARVAGFVTLHGEPGSGKSTALGHLAALFASASRLVLLDESEAATLEHVDPTALVICATDRTPPRPALARLRLARWSEDEWIEYLLRAHNARCASVMQRLHAADDAGSLRGVAELCSIALELMARDEAHVSVHSALEQHTEALLGDRSARSQIGSTCLRLSVAKSALSAAECARELEGLCGDAFRFVRHRSVRYGLAAEALARQLASGECDVELLSAIPRDLERRASPLVRVEPGAIACLRRWLTTMARDTPPSVASLWHAADRIDFAAWLRSVGAVGAAPALDRARLPRAPWAGLVAPRLRLEAADLSRAELPGSDLRAAVIRRANLADADLAGAGLEEIQAAGAQFTRARLNGCRATKAEFTGANFEGADLSHAQLSSAKLSGADLRQASLRGANLACAELAGAILSGADCSGANFQYASLQAVDLRQCVLAQASFRGAQLNGSNLESMNLDLIDFDEADLSRAHLTCASLRGAQLMRANLEGAHLADVDAEGANLREANLDRASFHMGSSRSGLVFHAMPMEGSRTGFYTDDYFDNGYKRAEEVRKANLRGVDLRGAKIAGTDFYLVDLRDALYTEDQLAHFRRCGAILRTR